MNEYEQAKLFADKILDRINADPDDDQAVVARQFLRTSERFETMIRERDQERKVYNDAIGRELATIKVLRECLKSIADMSDEESREPDDADWRFRCLSAIEVARRVIRPPPSEEGSA